MTKIVRYEIKKKQKSSLKIFIYGKFKLIDKDLLEGIEFVLLIKDKNRLLIVDRIDRAETQRE